MRIDGTWMGDEGGLQRPVLHTKVRIQSGGWIDCTFLLDTGADRTVLSAEILHQLGRPTVIAPQQLGGVGGTVETLQVWTELRFTQVNGFPATIGGDFAAFSDPSALEESVLGRDVLNLFTVIVDKRNDLICLLQQGHTYTIQGS